MARSSKNIVVTRSKTKSITTWSQTKSIVTKKTGTLLINPKSAATKNKTAGKNKNAAKKRTTAKGDNTSKTATFTSKHAGGPSTKQAEKISTTATHPMKLPQDEDAFISFHGTSIHHQKFLISVEYHNQ